MAAFKTYLTNPMALDLTSAEVKSQQDASRGYEELRVLREVAVFYLNKERQARCRSILNLGPTTFVFIIDSSYGV